MAVLVVSNEKTLAALRRRLFGEKASTKAARELTDAIREANPHADLDKLQPGTVLTIPEAPGLAVAGLSIDTSQAVAELAEGASQALQELVEAGAKHEDGARGERERSAKALKAKPVTDAARKDEQVKALVDSARKAVAEEEGHAKERQQTLEAAQKEWLAGLEALKQLAG